MTVEEFTKTYEFLKRISFYKMHVFKYSRRKGTKADLMENQVPPDEQEKRSKKLIELSNKNQKKYNCEYIDKNVEVLFEEQDEEYIKGHTANYLVVKVKKYSIEKYHNEIKNVKILEVDNEELIGAM